MKEGIKWLCASQSSSEALPSWLPQSYPLLALSSPTQMLAWHEFQIPGQHPTKQTQTQTQTPKSSKSQIKINQIDN